MPHVPVCPLFCCWRVNYVWEMGCNTSALLHIRAHIIRAIAPLPLMLLDFSRSSFNDTKWNLCGSEQMLSFDSLIRDFNSVVCCSDAVSAKEEWLLIICWWCRKPRQHETTQTCPLFSYCPRCFCLILGDLLLFWRLVQRATLQQPHRGSGTTDPGTRWREGQM